MNDESVDSKKLITLEGLESYYNKLSGLATSGSAEREENPDRLHNAVVMRTIFENAKNVKMYCGGFSLFRDSFRESIEAGEIASNTKKTEISKFLVDGLRNSLINFLERGGRLEVTMQNYDFKLEDESIYEALKKYIKSQVNFYKLSGNSESVAYIKHFTCADNKMYRRERDEISREAFVCFNNPEGAIKLSFRYEILKRFVSKVEFSA
jgi:hypothetical protein